MRPAGRFLRTEDVAQRIGLAPSSVRRIPAEELPFIAVCRRGTRRYREVEVLDYVHRHHAETSGDVDRLRVARGPYRKVEP